MTTVIRGTKHFDVAKMSQALKEPQAIIRRLLRKREIHGKKVSGKWFVPYKEFDKLFCWCGGDLSNCIN